MRILRYWNAEIVNSKLTENVFNKISISLSNKIHNSNENKPIYLISIKWNKINISSVWCATNVKNLSIIVTFHFVKYVDPELESSSRTNNQVISMQLVSNRMDPEGFATNAKRELALNAADVRSPFTRYVLSD